MEKRVLVLGSTGLIGHKVYNYCKKNTNYKMLNIAYRNKLNENTLLVDVINIDKSLEIIKSLKPDIIVNCIGVLISKSNKDPESSIIINALFPHKLKHLANELNAKLIHISTDCVFSGRTGQYTETSLKDGYDNYSKTKGLGEITEEPHVTLRTSVVGPELKTDGEELFHWFMSQKDSINGFTKAIWSGVSTLELAKAVVWAIEENITGLYHITNGKTINKYKLLNLFKKYTGHDIEILAVDGKEVDKSFIDTRKIIKYIIPDYEVMVKDMIDNIKESPELYNQYEIV